MLSLSKHAAGFFSSLLNGHFQPRNGPGRHASCSPFSHAA